MLVICGCGVVLSKSERVCESPPEYAPELAEVDLEQRQSLKDRSSNDSDAKTGLKSEAVGGVPELSRLVSATNEQIKLS